MLAHWSVIVGDVRDVLKSMPDGSVQMCCTSPPYWGLRDYGTARWDGGDDECDHSVSSGGPSQLEGASQRGRSDVARGDCRRCGAHRIDNQIGLEPAPDAYVGALVGVFCDVRRVLKDDGVLWLNLGDSYTANGGGGESRMIELGRPSANARHSAKGNGQLSGRTGSERTGLKPKDLCGIPWRVAFALQAEGWYLRSDIIWSKPNPMPESVTDRPTKAHEYVFLLSKRERYYYDASAIAEPIVGYMVDRIQREHRKGMMSVNGHWKADASRNDAGSGQPNSQKGARIESLESGRNARSVWTITTQPYPDAHFATFPEALPERCIKAGSRLGDTVLDPFCGSGTTGQVAIQLGRHFIGIELNPAYAQLARTRIGGAAPLFAAERPA